MAKIKVYAGVCGFVAEIDATSEDMRYVVLNIKSDCPDIKRLGSDLKAEPVDSFKEIECHNIGGVEPGHTFIDTRIYKRSSLYLHCSDCPVPAGIMKAVMLSAGLALPRNSSIEVLEK